MIGQGRLLADTPIADFAHGGTLEDAYFELTAPAEEFGAPTGETR